MGRNGVFLLPTSASKQPVPHQIPDSVVRVQQPQQQMCAGQFVFMWLSPTPKYNFQKCLALV